MARKSPHPRHNKKKRRPRVDEQRHAELLRLAQAEGRGWSLRRLAKATGLSDATVRRILYAAGLRQKTQRPARPEPSATPTSHSPAVPATMKMIAEHAGVSVSTVSLVMRGSPRIPAATRERIEQIAHELNYQPHPYVSAQMRAIRAGRIKQVRAVLGYLFGRLENLRWKQAMAQPYGPRRKFEAAERAARAKGYKLEVFDLFEFGENTQRQQRVLHSRGIQGLILDLPAYVATGCEFDFGQFSTVAFRDQAPLRMHVVGHDHFRHSIEAFARLWLLGYRRIGFLGADSQSTSTLFSREAGYRHAQYYLALPEDRLPILTIDTAVRHFQKHYLWGEPIREINRVGENDWIVSEKWDELLKRLRSGAPEKETVRLGLIERWLQQHRPDAIICEHFGVIDWLKTLGQRVPEDIGLVHLNLNEDVPNWTGIRRPDELIGQAAVEQLTLCIDRGASGYPAHPVVQHLAGDWVEGTTCRTVSPTTPLTRNTREWIEKALGDRQSLVRSNEHRVLNKSGCGRLC